MTMTSFCGICHAVKSDESCGAVPWTLCMAMMQTVTCLHFLYTAQGCNTTSESECRQAAASLSMYGSVYVIEVTLSVMSHALTESLSNRHSRNSTCLDSVVMSTSSLPVCHIWLDTTTDSDHFINQSHAELSSCRVLS